MKFFWKIYFSFTILFLAAFGIFGTWIIQITFEKSYQRVLEEGERDNRMYQLAFEMNLNMLDKVYRNERVIPVTASSITQNLSEPGNIYRVYNQSQNLLYQSQENFFRGQVLDVLTDEQPCGYEVLREGTQTWLLFACRSNLDDQIFYLENLKNISDIYQEREECYDWYTFMMVILTVITPMLVYVVTRLLTRSIDELSQTTRRFTSGDYEVRASQSVGGDEIAELARDFNHMADTLSEKMEELTMQAKRQEDFTASFAHELKTPLTSIIGYADMIRTIDCTKEETLEAANYIFHQGKRLESLSFKLLELIVSDKREYDFRPIFVPELVKETVQLTETKRKEKQIQLFMDLAAGTIFGDQDLLISALTNLLDNARKAVAENGRILIRGKIYGEGYILSVLDDGCGMEESEVSRITEAFYMIDKSRARKEGGSGLGMTLCSRIFDLHKAKWRIHSVLGKGTSIAIWFPDSPAKEG